MILKNKEKIIKILKSLVAGNDSLALSTNQEHPAKISIIEVTDEHIYLQATSPLQGVTGFYTPDYQFVTDQVEKTGSVKFSVAY